MCLWFDCSQDKADKQGVRWVQTGDAMDILQAQVERGFAHVPEQTLEQLLTHKTKPLPVEDEEDSDRKTLLAMACIAAIKPDITMDKAVGYLNTAFAEENPDYYHDKYVDTTALSDVLVQSEVQKVHEWEAKVQATKLKKKKAVATRARNVATYFKPAKFPAYTAATKRGPRWLPKKDEKSTSAITKWIGEWCPHDSKVVCDDYNGRWRVIAPDLNWRSVSWTCRGYEKAATEVVHQAWTYHTDFTGEACPFSLDDLVKRFQDVSL